MCFYRISIMSFRGGGGRGGGRGGGFNRGGGRGGGFGFGGGRGGGRGGFNRYQDYGPPEYVVGKVPLFSFTLLFPFTLDCVCTARLHVRL